MDEIKPQKIKPGEKEKLVARLRGHFFYNLSGHEIYLAHPPSNFPTRYHDKPTIGHISRTGNARHSDAFPLAIISDEKVIYSPNVNGIITREQQALSRELSDFLEP